MTNSSIVSLAAAVALRDLWFPQADRDGMMWWRSWDTRSAVWQAWECDHFDWDSLGPHTIGQEAAMPDEWVAAPDALTGLRHCAALGYNVTIEMLGGDDYYYWSCRVCPKQYPVVTESEADADLIVAIADHHAQHHAAANATGRA